MSCRIPVRLALVACAAWVCCAQPASAWARGGLNFQFALGGAMVSGPDDLTMFEFNPSDHGLPPCANPSECDTNNTGGFAFGLSFGYNVLGYGGLDLEFLGHGNLGSGGGKGEGAAHASLIGSINYLQFIESLRDRKYDSTVYFGYGIVSMSGYHLDYADNPGRGWSGTSYQLGATFDYDVGRGVSVGLDLKFILPQYERYITNWDDGIEFTAKSEPDVFIFAPLATITFHMLDPEEK